MAKQLPSLVVVGVPNFPRGSVPTVCSSCSSAHTLMPNTAALIAELPEEDRPPIVCWKCLSRLTQPGGALENVTVTTLGVRGIRALIEKANNQ